MTTAIGLLALRVLLGLLLAGHGLQKAFGWFNGPGRANAAKTFDGWGFVPARRLVLLAASTETISGLMITLGIATPLACAMALGTLIVAMSPSFPNGLWAVHGGFELPFIYAGMAAVLATTGPGTISIDSVIDTPHSALIGVGATLLGVAGAVPPLLRRAAELSRRRGSYERTAASAGVPTAIPKGRSK